MTGYIAASLLELGVLVTVKHAYQQLYKLLVVDLQLRSLTVLSPFFFFSPFQDPVITNALSCLRPFVGNLGNTYATALLAYTFSLAGEASTRSQLLNALDSVAISEGETCSLFDIHQVLLL